MKTKLFTLAVVFSCISVLSNASHVVGVRITYEYTGSSTIFKLKFYRDCAGIPAPSSALICFTSASGCAPSFTTTLQLDAANSGFQVPFNSCNGVGLTTCSGGNIFAFEEYNYTGVVLVPPCNDWQVTFNECCRNAAITNVVNPDFFNASVSTFFDNLNYPTNSSPEFNAVPLNYYCAGIPTIIDYSAFDNDGDSLSYEFTPIYDGSCNTNLPISFMSPFTFDQPLATLSPTIFDPIGGQILFTPSAIQISVFGFKVNEYRNGVLIGSVRRDDEIIVVGGLVNPDTIAGRVFYDINLNSVFDAGDVPASNVIVHMGPGNSYVSTAANGKYDFQTGNGVFTISIPNPPLYINMVPASITINATGTGIFYGNNDIALQPTANINDLEISINNSINPTPGLNYPVLINYSNSGTTVQATIDIVVTLDPLLTFLSSSPAPASSLGNVHTWFFATMGLFSNGTISIQTAVDTTAVLGDPVTCSATISSAAIDQTPLNNTNFFTDVVAAPFDPNNKEVYPVGDLSMAFITSQQWLNYKINFQNLGTALAQTVKIGDLLDFDLDMGTIELVSSSFPCSMSLQNPQTLKFNFFGINLPSASQNEPASHGFVEFRVKPKATLQPGAMITNNATIVFDFNSPIYTNLVQNRVVQSTSINDITADNINITVYPNPAIDIVTIEISATAKESVGIKLFNLPGQLVIEKNIILLPGLNSIQLLVNEISDGMYFLNLNKQNGTRVIKLVVQ